MHSIPLPCRWSAGLAPLRMLAVYAADLAIALGQAGAITHQAADGSVFTPVIDRGNRIAGCVEKGVRADHERSGSYPVQDRSVHSRIWCDQFSSSSVFAAIGANQNQGRKPYDRDEEYVQDGLARSLTVRSRRGVVAASGFLISFFGSIALLSAISCVGSATTNVARGSAAARGAGKSA
jgi:hypothetical protein